MHASAIPTTARNRRVLTSLTAGLAAALALATASTMVAAAPAAAESGGSETVMVHANLKSDLSVERFQEDLREVFEAAPDFVTYNEVPERQDWVLAPEGYELHRAHRNRYTRATPVAWRTDRWTAVDRGTFKISGYREVPDGKRVRLGLRFANWATLRSPEGRQLSVVSVHFAPVFRDDGKTYDLLRHSVRRLKKLATRLAPAGPVLVGGDFNVHYRSGRYPRNLFDKAGLVPTYDTLGSYFPTGDHKHKATIDYVFNRGASQLMAQHHEPIELNSDHDGVRAGLSWEVDAPEQSTMITNDPEGDRDAQRLVANDFADRIRAAGAGDVVEVATTRLDLRSVFRRLRGALDRDVHVRVTVRGKKLVRLERRIRRVIRRSDDAGSSFNHCTEACRESWRDAGVPPGLLMVGDAAGEWRVRVDTSRKISRRLVERTSRAWIHTGEHSLAEGEDLLRAVR